MERNSIVTQTVLSIAGSDPSGGAGIQADLKTMTSIGVYGAAAVTCLTVQNSHGVQEIHPLPPALIHDQVKAVLDDYYVTHIKIGMTGTMGIIRTLGKLLGSFSGEVIYDPVLASTTGESLLQKEGLPALKKYLLNQITIVTPNIGELEQLTDTTISSTREALASAELLLKAFSGLQAVVIKGGHLESRSTTIQDFLVQRDGILHASKRQRQKSGNLHGTGCTYASALASYLCLGQDTVTAFRMSGDYMDRIIRVGIQNCMVKSGNNGPLCHHRISG
ncbi:MAG: bifunctional hydroxymethylpyrimidine kinase/phosphomethylpyrimidine kinase [Proteobacteria bacterium]|nr:bifunctional hydroxymethylpyrimidine kinase/phosphomethylpyrimidine kinase [Pseudomonadota bacterium]MBU1453775.1 bifunctional hydroxymethylpyrimidine kinase/phosphomethylpyrimidine kinase [Pseudomonadota bacterium]